IENHIYTCDTCMDIYLSMLDSHPITGTISEDFTDQVVEKINKRHPSQMNTPRQSKPRKAVAHYFLAAGLTIILTVSGIFQGMLDVTNNEQMKNRSSITKQLMQNTNQLLDQLKEEYNK